MKIITLTCLIFLLIACASKPKVKMEEAKKLLTPVRTEITCTLTCNNREYLILGGKTFENRILPKMSKDVGSTIINITSAPESKYSKRRRLVFWV